MTARTLSLEKLFTHPKALGIVDASPVQRAICRVIEGRPLGPLAHDHDVLEAFGVACADELPVEGPRELYLFAAIKTGKTHLAVATAIWASQTVDVTGLGPGEIPRVSIVSLNLDLGDVAFSILRGNMLERTALRSLLIGEPGTDSVLLRHPTGRPIEIKVVAGSRAGGTLVARHDATTIFDEFTRMVGADDGVVNFADARAAVLERGLPGARIIAIGSPHAPFGPAYEAFERAFGHPTRDLVVCRARGPVMNPARWTPERCERARQRDPHVYQTDVLAEFASADGALIGVAEYDRAARKAPAELPRSQGTTYNAALDPASRGNASALIVVASAEREGRMRHRVALCRQWVPARGAPVDFDALFSEVAIISDAYGLSSVLTDQYAADPLKQIAIRHGVTLVDVATTRDSRINMYETLRTLTVAGDLEYAPDATLRADVLSLRKTTTQNGIDIAPPKAKGGKRHSDYAPALALALVRAARPAARPRVRMDLAALAAPEVSSPFRY